MPTPDRTLGAPPQQHIDQGYEPSDMSGRGALAFALGFGLFMLTLGTLVQIHKGRLDAQAWRAQRHAPPVVEGYQYPPQPQLQMHPQQDYDDYVNRSEAWLSSYGWVDRAHGVVHIPVDRAMDLVLKEGVGAR